MNMLFVYRFGILGGVCSQIHNRLNYLAGTVKADLLFYEDHGAGRLFPGHTVHITGEAAKIADIVRRNSYDLITVIDTPEFLEAVKGTQITTPIVLEVHTTTVNLAYLAKLRSHSSALGRIKAILTPSKYLADRILYEFGYQGVKPVLVVPNAIDVDIFQAREIAVQAGRKILLWVGKLDSHKNWRGFVDICYAMSSLDPDAEFWMAGGYTASETTIKEFLSVLDLYGLMDRVRWLPRVEYGEMPELYTIAGRSGGALVITSSNESFGMTAIEALLCSCPVISSRVGALPEVIPQFRRNIFYSYNDSEGATSIIKNHLLEDNGLRDEIETHLPSLRQKYSTENVSKLYLETLSRI